MAFGVFKKTLSIVYYTGILTVDKLKFWNIFMADDVGVLAVNVIIIGVNSKLTNKCLTEIDDLRKEMGVFIFVILLACETITQAYIIKS